MEVVMGIQPELPATIRAMLPVEAVGESEYVDDLVKYLKVTHDRVRELAKELEFEKEGKETGGRGGQQLVVGDLVALKRSEKAENKGVRRFAHTTDGVIYRVKEVSGTNTYSLEPLCGGADEALEADETHGHTVNCYSADRLVKLDMPEYESVPEAGPQGIEIFQNELGAWVKGTVEKVAVDGRLLVRFEGSGLTQWLDVTRTRYRWLVGERPLAGEEAPAALERTD